MVWTDSRRVSRAMRYLGYCHRLFIQFRRLSRSMARFSNRSNRTLRLNYAVPLPRRNKFLWFGLFRVRSPLLTESLCFLFLGLLRCFTSPRVAMGAYEFSSTLSAKRMGFPIRNSAGQSLFAAHRSLSQLTTSFIAS